MKNRNILNIIGVMALAMASHTAMAQELPDSFNYQAVINAEDGSPVANKDITVEISIMQGSNCDNNPGGCNVLWQELHTPKTNEFGLFSVEIGDKNAINTTGGSLDKYDDIRWMDLTDGCYYMQVRVDFGESKVLNGMTDLGITKFSSVPYSLVALSTDLAERAKKLDSDENGKVTVKLEQLGDVKIDNTSLAANQHLVYDGTAWKNTSPGEAARIGIADLDGVKITDGNLANRCLLQYNADTKIWENKLLSLDDLKNVHSTISSAKDNDVLTFDKTANAWKPMAITIPEASVPELDKLSNVKITTATLSTKKYLMWDKSISKWVNGELETQESDPCIWTKSANNGTTATNYYQTTKTISVGYDLKVPSGCVMAVSNSTGEYPTLFNGKGITIGHKAASRANGTGSIALGSGGDVNGASCIAGAGTLAFEKTNCIVFGSGATAKANDCLIFGPSNTSDNKNSAVFGTNNEAVGENSLTCGAYSVKGSSTEYIRLAVGGGTSTTERKNVFTVDYQGNVRYAGTCAQSSDQRLKTNIKTMTSALDNVMQLRGVTYNWDKTIPYNANASTDTQFGFIAQEVEKIFPELVKTSSDGYKTVNYIGAIPVLTEAIKDQQKEIEDLKSENEQLKNTLSDLLKRVEALEKK